MYDQTFFDKSKTLIPSARGELEITDVITPTSRRLMSSATWREVDDAGTFESLLRAANLVREKARKYSESRSLRGAPRSRHSER